MAVCNRRKMRLLVANEAQADCGCVLDFQSAAFNDQFWGSAKKSNFVKYMFTISECGPSNWELQVFTHVFVPDSRWIEVVKMTTPPSAIDLLKLEPKSSEADFCKSLRIGDDTADELQLYLWVSDNFERKENFPRNKYFLVTYESVPPSTMKLIQKKDFDEIEQKIKPMPAIDKADSGCVLQFLSLSSNIQFWNSAREEELTEFQYTIEKCGPNPNWWELNVFIHKGIANTRWVEVVHLKSNNALFDLLQLELDSSEQDFCKSTRIGNESEDELQLYLWVSDQYIRKESSQSDKYFLVTYKKTPPDGMETVDKSTFDQIDQTKKPLPAIEAKPESGRVLQFLSQSKNRRFWLLALRARLLNKLYTMKKCGPSGEWWQFDVYMYKGDPNSWWIKVMRVNGNNRLLIDLLQLEPETSEEEFCKSSRIGIDTEDELQLYLWVSDKYIRGKGISLTGEQDVPTGLEFADLSCLALQLGVECKNSELLSFNNVMVNHLAAAPNGETFLTSCAEAVIGRWTQRGDNGTRLFVANEAKAEGGCVLNFLCQEFSNPFWGAARAEKLVKYLYTIDECTSSSDWAFDVVTRLDVPDSRWIEVVKLDESPKIIDLLKLEPNSLEKEFCKSIRIGVDTEDQLQLYLWVSDNYEKKEYWPRNNYFLVTYNKNPPSTMQPVKKTSFAGIVRKKPLPANEVKTDSGCVLQFLSIPNNIQFWRSARQEKLIEFQYTIEKCGPSSNWWQFNVFLYKGIPNSRWIEVVQVKSSKVLVDLLQLEPDSSEEVFCKSTRIGNESEDELQLYLWVSDQYLRKESSQSDKYFLVTYKTTPPDDMEPVKKSAFDHIDRRKKMEAEFRAKIDNGCVLQFLSISGNIGFWTSPDQRELKKFMYTIEQCRPSSKWWILNVFFYNGKPHSRWVEVVNLKNNGKVLYDLLKLEPDSWENEICRSIRIGNESEDELQLYIWVSAKYEQRQRFSTGNYFLVTYKTPPPHSWRIVDKSTFDQIDQSKKPLPAIEAKVESGCVLQFLSLTKNINFWNSPSAGNLLEFQYTIKKCGPNSNWWRFNVFFYKGEPNSRWIEVLNLKNSKKVLYDLLKLEPDSSEEEFCRSTRIGNESEDELQLYILVSDEKEGSSPDKYFLVTYKTTSPDSVETVDKSTFDQIDPTKKPLPAIEAKVESGCVLQFLSLPKNNEFWNSAIQENLINFQYKIEKCGPSSNWWRFNVFFYKGEPNSRWIEVLNLKNNKNLLLDRLKLEPDSSEEEFCRSTRIGNESEDELQLYLWVSGKYEKEGSSSTDKYFLVTYKTTMPDSVETVDKSTFDQMAQTKKPLPAIEATVESGCVLQFLSLPNNIKFWNSPNEGELIEFQYTIKKCDPSNIWWRFNVFFYKGEPNSRWIEVLHLKNNEKELLDLLKLEPNSSEEEFCKSTRIGNVSNDELQLYIWVSDKSEKEGNSPTDKYFLVTYKTTLPDSVETVDKSTFDQMAQTKKPLPAIEAKVESGCVLQFLSISNNMNFWNSPSVTNLIEFQYTIKKCGPNPNWWRFNVFFYKGEPNSRWIEVLQFKERKKVFVDLLELNPDSSEEEFCKSTRIGNESEDELQLYIWVSDKYKEEGSSPIDNYFLVTYKSIPPDTVEAVDKSTFLQIDQTKNVPRD